MFEYSYTRDLVDGRYNINNEARVDGEGEQITLWSEIKAASFASKLCGIKCSGDTAKVCTSEELTGAEQTELDTIVSDHKNNT